jgi:hypothetical protein
MDKANLVAPISMDEISKGGFIVNYTRGSGVISTHDKAPIDSKGEGLGNMTITGVNTSSNS